MLVILIVLFVVTAVFRLMTTNKTAKALLLCLAAGLLAMICWILLLPLGL